MKAKAVIFVQPEKVEVGEVELATPTPRDIVIKTEVSGISVGTERWAYLGKRSEVKFPNVPGYMAVGTILSAGDEAAEKGWREGERVYYFNTRFGEGLDGKSWMGSHVSHGVVDVCGDRGKGPLEIHHCEKVPSGVSPEDAALLGLCGVAMRGIEMAVVPAGARVLVCGLGVIGQFALQVCLLKGAMVTATDVVDSRLAVARELGAHRVVHGRNDDLGEVSKEVAPDGYDVIIDTSSVTAVVNGLFPLLKLRGKFIFQGWYPPPTNLDLNALHQRLPSAYFPCAHSAVHVETALLWAQKGWVRTKPLVSHTFRPDEATKAYDLIAKGSDNFLGLLIDWR